MTLLIVTSNSCYDGRGLSNLDRLGGQDIH